MSKNTVLKLIFVFILSNFVNGHLHLDWDVPNEAMDQSLYKRVLDSEECRRQVNYLWNNTLLLGPFLDAGLRTPRGVLAGNTVDLGNYHQCLGINIPFDETSIEGKYCMIRVPFNQELNIPSMPTSQWFHFDPRNLLMNEDVIKKLNEYSLKRTNFKAAFGEHREELRSGPGNPLQYSVFRLAVCIPKPCTTEEAISALLFNVSSIGFQYEDDFCRLPNDKPWVPADYTAMALFSLFGFLSLMSTAYELNHIFIHKKDPKSANVYYSMFSVYGNTNRLLTFSRSSSLECLDGVRSLAMIWVLVGHSFSSQQFSFNPIDSFQWMISLEALWVTAGHITVDTFFMLSGLLVVYTTANKLTSVSLLKNIHIFYLHRLLRMFPVLATTVLLESSLFNHVSDGPVWGTVISQAHRCRTFWWSTLLHVQNYVNSENICIGATWYLAIDVQLHILSPIVLIWVLSGNKRLAWSALTLAVIASITGATVYNFIKEFPTGMITPARPNEMMYYMVYYYMNTLTRAPPFLVGMVYGYLLHIWRGKRPNISTILNLILWVLSLSLLALVLYCVYPTMQIDWNNQTVDSLINSFMRPAWALGLGWVIFACVHGYGGPINWFLSLRLWKLPARLSYAMYLLHFPLMVVVNSSLPSPIYFSVSYITFLFCAYFVMSMSVALIVMVFIDMPFTTLIKLFMDKAQKSQVKTKNNSLRARGDVNGLVQGDLKNGFNRKTLNTLNVNELKSK